MSMSLYASKEEYEQAHAARWYCLDRDGVAMLCKDEADARTQAAENDDCWPGRAPHRAVLLGEVSAADAHIPMARLIELETAEHERHKPLMQAVEWLLDDGHMNTEHLARLRAAWEAALGPNVISANLPQGDELA